MKKLLVLLIVVVVAIGGYAHYTYWLSQSNQIKSHIEGLAAGKSDGFKVTYDEIETAGYPFRHEVSLKNPCFYFLDVDPNLSLSVADGCLKGTMLLSYHPFSSDRSLFVETNGEMIVTIPQAGAAATTPVLIKGHLKQEYAFEDGYEFAKSTDIVYFLENLQKASINAKNMSITSVEDHPKEFVDDMTATMDYARKPVDDKSQKIQLSLEYSSLLGDAIQAYEPPLDEIFKQLSGQIKEFNKKAGVNKARYDIAIVLPSWAVIKQVFDKINTSNYSFDDIPDFSIDATQSGKNNFSTGKGSLDAVWAQHKDQSFQFKIKNSGVQDITKEGQKEFSSLLQDVTKEFVKMMLNASSEKGANNAQIYQSQQFEDLFKGLPSHLEIDLNLVVNKNLEGSKKEHLSVILDPLTLGTDKGTVTFIIDYNSDKPFNATLEFESLVRMVDGLITRYNIIAKVIDQGKRFPQITQLERDHLLAILQKYSDKPESLPKTVTFTITQAADGLFVIGKQQDIRALVGELAFFFQHIQQKDAEA